MRTRAKILTTLALLIPASMILYFSVYPHQHRSGAGRLNFSYKDGLFYKKNSSELFTGTITDTVNLIVSFDVVNGKKHGPFITFYLNGSYEKYGLIDNNRNEGEWRYFYPNGQLECVGSYRNDKPSGKWIFYYPNGIVEADGMYAKGLKQGAWMYYDSSGKWTSIQFFFNGIARPVLENV